MAEGKGMNKWLSQWENSNVTLTLRKRLGTRGYSVFKLSYNRFLKRWCYVAETTPVFWTRKDQMEAWKLEWPCRARHFGRTIWWWTGIIDDGLVKLWITEWDSRNVPGSFYSYFSTMLWCNTCIVGKIIILILLVKCLVTLSQKLPITTPPSTNARHLKRTMARGQDVGCIIKNLAELCPWFVGDSFSIFGIFWVVGE